MRAIVTTVSAVFFGCLVSFPSGSARASDAPPAPVQLAPTPSEPAPVRARSELRSVPAMVTGMTTSALAIPVLVAGYFVTGICVHQGGTLDPFARTTPFAPSCDSQLALALGGSALFLGGVGLTAYGATTATNPVTPPAEQWKRRSVPLMVGGGLAIILAVPVLFLDAVVLGMCESASRELRRPSPGCYGAGALGAAAGVGLAYGGVQGVVYGAMPVRVEGQAAAPQMPSLVPRVSLGLRSGSLAWQF